MGTSALRPMQSERTSRCTSALGPRQDCRVCSLLRRSKLQTLQLLRLQHLLQDDAAQDDVADVVVPVFFCLC